MKTRIFIDFWNFQLSILERTHPKFRINWKAISPWLMAEASKQMESKLEFDGTKVYLSYNPKAPQDRNFHRWANTVLARFPGIDIDIRERKPKGPPKCQACHEPITICSNCGENLNRTIEKGVDTAIVTDLLSLAWEKLWDVAILVSSDRDFIPAVKLLSNKSYKVVNAHFPPYGADLAKVSWASIDLMKGLSEFERNS